MNTTSDSVVRRICEGHRKVCEDRVASIDLFADGELCDTERADVQAHLEGCPGCRAYHDSRLAMRESLRSCVGSQCISQDFRSRLQLSIAQARIGCPTSSDRTEDTHRRFLVAAASAALAATAVVGTVGVMRSQSAPSGGEGGEGGQISQGEVAGQATIRSPVVMDALRWHRRQMPVEVTGPNEGLVADWFVSKVEFPVRAPEFSHDATLLGGRIGNVQNEDAAYLVYEVDGTKLSVLVFEAEASGLTQLTGGEGRVYIDNSNGYNVGIGQRDGIGYAFTSELPSDRFVELVAHSLE